MCGRVRWTSPLGFVPLSIYSYPLILSVQKKLRTVVLVLIPLLFLILLTVILFDWMHKSVWTTVQTDHAHTYHLPPSTPPTPTSHQWQPLNQCPYPSLPRPLQPPPSYLQDHLILHTHTHSLILSRKDHRATSLGWRANCRRKVWGSNGVGVFLCLTSSYSPFFHAHSHTFRIAQFSLESTRHSSFHIRFSFFSRSARRVGDWQL